VYASKLFPTHIAWVSLSHSDSVYSAPGVQGDKISAGARRTFGASFIARF
jgi:hypothetical protein